MLQRQERPEKERESSRTSSERRGSMKGERSQISRDLTIVSHSSSESLQRETDNINFSNKEGLIWATLDLSGINLFLRTFPFFFSTFHENRSLHPTRHPLDHPPPSFEELLEESIEEDYQAASRVANSALTMLEELALRRARWQSNAL